MAATGKTPILLYGSTTATNVPVAGNLTNSSDGCEIAINVADKNLFFKDSTNTVNTVPIRQSSASSNGWLSSTDWTTFNNKVSSQWVTSGSNIYYTTGSVGIGTNSPSVKLDVSGSGTQSIRAITTDTSGTTIGRVIAQYTGGGGGTASAIDLRAGDNYTFLTSTTNTPVLFGTNSTERMRIDTSGNVSIANGNLVIGTSGKGIDFSATAGTGTSELLADYEEGTWTPTITAGSGSITSYTVQQAQYTKIGRLVTVTLRYTITNAGTGAGATIATLPYTAAYDGVGTCVELAALGVSGRAWVPATAASVYITKYDNTTLIVTNYQVNATVSYMV